MNDILVSISCTTFNHEKYIVDALEGVLSQRVNFDFEILVHDDASTDGTQEIIRKYCEKYPDIIMPIYQIENQYSKGVKVGVINRRRARGKYIAICEGDDYWTDTNKLQKQIEYMEKYPECSLCFHDAILVDEDKKNLGAYPGKYIRKSGIKSIDELNFIPTASKVYRKEITENLPDWYFNAAYGDFASMLVCSNYGHIYYMNDVMSAYRTNVPGSVTYNHKYFSGHQKNILIDKSTLRIQELKAYNKWSGYKNDEIVSKMIIEEEFRKLIYEKSFKIFTNKKYRSTFKNQSILSKFNTVLKIIVPDLIYNSLRNNTKRLIYNISNLKKKGIKHEC